jgi:hypothetical protein
MATAKSRNHALERDESHVRYGARLSIITFLRKNKGQAGKEEGKVLQGHGSQR